MCLAICAERPRHLRDEMVRRKIKADCVWTGSSDRRTKIALLGALSGAGSRGGFTLIPELYHHPLVYDPEKSLIDNNLRLAGLAGCDTRHREPTVFYSAAEVVTAEGLRERVAAGGAPVVVLVTQTSGGQRTGWFRERFVEVVRGLHADGYAVAYVGTAAEAGAIEEIKRAAGGIGTSVAGETTVTVLAALLAMSDYVLTLDTGTMHVGRAVGTPMVVLGPSWQKPLEWMPLGVDHVRILRGQDRADMPAGYQLDEVAASDVMEAFSGLAARFPASEGARRKRVERSISQVDHLA